MSPHGDESRAHGDGFSRRRFIAGAAAGTAAFTMFSRWPKAAFASPEGGSLLPGLSGDFLKVAADPSAFRTTFASVVGIGAQVIRFPIDWAQIERSPGAYDWSGCDALHGELLWNGLKGMPAIVNAPEWLAADCKVTPGGLRYPVSDKGLNALGDFAVAVTRYFSRFRPCVHGLEVWPRPNLGPSSLAQPAEFALMVDAVALETGAALRPGEQVFEPVAVVAGAVRVDGQQSEDFVGALQDNAVATAAGVELPSYPLASDLEQAAADSLPVLSAASPGPMWLNTAPPETGPSDPGEAASLKRLAQGQLQQAPVAMTFSFLTGSVEGDNAHSSATGGGGAALITGDGNETSSYHVLAEAWNGA